MKNRLTIHGWSNLRGDLKGGYGIASVQHHNDYYRIQLAHPSKPHMEFIIKREGWLSGGEWHYSTYVQTGHKVKNPGTVSISFLRDPQNLIAHINTSID